MVDMNALSELLQRGKAKDVKEMTQQAVDEGISVQTILDDGLLSGMNVIGVKFKNNEIFVPEVLIAARAMNAGMEVIKPLLIDNNIESRGVVVIGTVKGDLHDIGKNLVGMMMRGKGLTVIDLGTVVAPQTFIESAISNKADIIACSALLTTTMKEMGNVVKAVKDARLDESVKVMIGGAPVTESFKDMIQADAYSSDAASAAEIALQLCRKVS
ncbi:MAG: cobalamin-dependent protein [Sphaerochaetaceae bacterium]|nr:cobalamin-dependent protein [Sphaerochaetaceae bacterium]